MNDNSNDDTDTRMDLLLSLPRHNSFISKPSQKLMEDWETRSGHRFDTSTLRAYADSPVRHNGCHEWGDIRSRHVDKKYRAFVRAVVEAREEREIHQVRRLAKMTSEELGWQ